MVIVEPSASTPFEELPEALVEEMLSKSTELGEKLSTSFREIQEKKQDTRKELKNKGLLKNDSDFIKTPVHPTTCGVDGSYAIEKLLTTDIVALAGVAVEGLIPPTDKRHWPRPHHYVTVKTIEHNDSTSVVARAIMMTMELELAAKAPHDVVFLDGSMTTPFIFLNQALQKINQVPEELSTMLKERLEVGFKSYKEILSSLRSDKIFAAVPKYTSKKEVSNKVGLTQYDDRGLLSFILSANELIDPLPLEPPQQPWHISGYDSSLKSIVNDIISSLNELHVLYYRPYDYIPALRLEVSKSIAGNQHRLSILLESVKLQCGAPSIMEPYPLYLADRMVKHLGSALPAIRKATTQEMAAKWEDDLGSIYLAMHGYRTETG